MNNFETQLNLMLESILRSILKIEESALRGYGKVNISINEMHMLEAIGKEKEKEVKISKVAKLMGITLPSTTVAINKLVKKGFLSKQKCENDKRVMYVQLTDLGHKINRVHSFFHKKIADKISDQLEDSEKNVLMDIIFKLNEFFKKYLERDGYKI